jgi:hypothetical protein
MYVYPFLPSGFLVNRPIPRLHRSKIEKSHKNRKTRQNPTRLGPEKETEDEKKAAAAG